MIFNKNNYLSSEILLVKIIKISYFSILADF